MRLTVYTDYTLRVMMYLAVKHKDDGWATIEEMARAYDISRSHLMKIVHELGQTGFIETMRGRTGGTRLARPPSQISIGALVRAAEKDFAIVACHDTSTPHNCAIFQACNLKRGLARAMDAFMAELDRMTLDDAIGAPSVAASLLGVERPGAAELATIRIPPPGSGRRGVVADMVDEEKASKRVRSVSRPVPAKGAEKKASAASKKVVPGRRPRAA